MTAEPYGFGPSSKALAIARALANVYGVRTDFTGVGTAYAAATREASLFNFVSASAREDAESLTDAVRGYDRVISVMEPSLALAAAVEGVPCLYVDSLFWMWDWPDHLADAGGSAEQMLRRISDGPSGRRQDALVAALQLPMHEAQYMAHRAASQVCYQQYGNDVKTGQSKTRDACQAKMVGAIIDRVPVEEASPGAPAMIVSFSGLSNELTDQANATGWARSVLGVVADAVQGTKFESNTRVGGNAEILATLDGSIRGSLEVKPWSTHGEMMRDLDRAAAFAAPPGITSIAEAWALSVPFFALPNQHYAHASILDRLWGGQSNTFPGIYVEPPPLRGALAEATAAVLGGVTEELRQGTPARGAAVGVLRDFLTGLETSRQALLTRQNTRLTELFGDVGGASQVATEALRLY